MIYLTGDVHFPIDKHKLERAAEEGLLRAGDILIVTGDSGVVWGTPERTARAIEAIKKLPYTILWVDGNHENFNLLESFPIVPKYNSVCHKISDNCYHLCRGNIYTIEGKTFLALGGAMSLDRAVRVKGVDWFEQEELTGDVYKRVVATLDNKDMRVDYVLSHDCPIHIFSYLDPTGLLKIYVPNKTSDILSMIDAQVDCSKWFFGHHHLDRAYCNNKYYCLYNTIINLDGEICMNDTDYTGPRAESLDDF